jgi:hypothetical protein
MIQATKKLTRQSLAATWILLSTMYLHAQTNEPIPSPPNYGQIAVIVIIVLSIIVGILIGFANKRKSRLTDLPERPNPKPTPVSLPTLQTTSAPPPKKSAGLIFISYRRVDSQHITGRIYDRLSTQFGQSSVFKDVDAIPLGVDFREHLQEKVGQCSVLVAVIGKDWNPTASGIQRLADPRDHLRIEIETALERRIPVIPILVDGVVMPDEKDLPPSLARLAYYNGISVRPDPDFHHDADRLLRGIESLLSSGSL